jgi:hypothetical protein
MSKKLYHPHVEGWSVEVDDDKVDDYADAGWRKTEPTSARPKTSGNTAAEDSK